MVENLIERAQLLFQQERYKDAETILLQLLAREPGNVRVLAIMSEIKIQEEKYKEAEVIINNAIGLSPESGYLYYIKAKTAIHLDKYDDAEKCLETAVGLNPYDADFFAFHASIKLRRKQYEQALELADHALEIDPSNILALNNRSQALIKLDRKDESYQTIEGALNEDPNNAYTHANYGWGLLEKGEHKKALVHFSEALKNDPNSGFAQAGMAQALKARYAFYRWFLNYSFWIGNLTAKYQWAVIIGFYVGVRILRTLAEKYEDLQPVLVPLIILLSLIAFSTWVITPISNLFLRINKYGKHLLDSNEILSSNFVGISLAVFLLALLAWLVTGNQPWIVVAAFGFTMMIPCSAMFTRAKYKYSLLIYAIVMAFLGTGAIAISFATGELFNTFTMCYAFGLIGFQWAANYLVIKEDNR